MSRRIPLAPVEGWVTVGLLTLMCLTMAWSIDDVALVLGNGGFTDFLAPMAVAGVLVGFIGAKVGWGRWLTYLVGALFAALIVPIVVGLQLPGGGTIALAYEATATSMYQAVYDLVVLDLQLTNEYGHYMLFLGLLVWGTSMFASYAAFGHRRPINAIVIVGLVLLINMALTTEDQLRYLVLYTLSGLLLLVRYHVLDEQTEWLRRRIGDPASISGIYLRGGAIFIAVAVFGSLLLTNVARSAPLAGSWNGLSTGLVELSRSLQRFLPTGGNTRPIGNDFDPNGTTIRGSWHPNNDLVATIKVPITEKRRFYWRATSFDEFTMNAWRNSDPAKTEIDTDAALLDGTAEAPDPRVSDAVTFTITPAAGPIVLSPATPVSVDQPTELTLVGPDGYFGAINRRNDSVYTVTADIRKQGNDPGEISVAALEGAGTEYPPEIEALYGADAVPEGAIPAGGQAEQLLDRLVDEAPNPDNPYDFAEFLRQRFVQSPESGGIFTYVTDINSLMEASCKSISIVECFATYKQGFCQYYASTMAIFLREQGIPARIAEGYLPAGQRSAQGEEVIRGGGRHQWVEVYFPGYGWYAFDPTGGGISRQPALTPGVPGTSPLPGPSGGAIPTRPRESDFEPQGTGGGGTGGSGGPSGPLIAITILLAVIVGGLAFVAWQRGPRDGTTADHAYRTVTRLAARFGFGPRPNQTVYEYSGSLGDVLPIVRPELETVAHAKVETAYGRGSLSADRLGALRAAERRLRLNLLRLAFRRGERRRRR